jgi:hypothetical protein
MSEESKSEATEVATNVPSPAPAVEAKLSAEAEIDLLRQVHVFLQDFPIPGKLGGQWSRVLDGIGLVANSLIAKQEESVKSALAAEKTDEPKV